MSDSRTRQVLESLVNFTKSSRLFQISLLAGVFLLIGYSSWRTKSLSPASGLWQARIHPVRNWAGRVVAVFSRELGRRISGQPELLPVVPFYRELENLLKKHWGLERKPGQTHREFAVQAGSMIAGELQEESLSNGVVELLHQVTDAFYQARFATIPLDKKAVAGLENQIRHLEQQLKYGRN